MLIARGRGRSRPTRRGKYSRARAIGNTDVPRPSFAVRTLMEECRDPTSAEPDDPPAAEQADRTSGQRTMTTRPHIGVIAERRYLSQSQPAGLLDALRRRDVRVTLL